MLSDARTTDCTERVRTCAQERDHVFSPGLEARSIDMTEDSEHFSEDGMMACESLTEAPEKRALQEPAEANNPHPF
jgi:hypothetical protein